MSAAPLPPRTRAIAAALERARADARPSPSGGWAFGAPDGRPRARRLAIGDPQAPLERLLHLLDRHGALGADGRVAPDVLLVSMGDHFDWGGGSGPGASAAHLAAARAAAAEDGLAFLTWLAAHPADQVIILAGNHDLGRVGELAGLDDPRFAAAQADADVLYAAPSIAPEREAAFALRHGLPTAELAARDFSSFRAVQAELVAALLRAGRARVAWAASRALLLTHAGVTRRDLGAAGLDGDGERDAETIAAALEQHLRAAIAAWRGLEAPLAIPGLHQPGTPGEEGRGIFFHRPSNPERGRDRGHPELFDGPVRRRFDPRDLPRGLVQAIGHIHDQKCRELLEGWTDGGPGALGPLRELATDGARVRYALGVERDADRTLARMLFLDGKAHAAAIERYELLDLDHLAPAEAPGSRAP